MTMKHASRIVFCAMIIILSSNNESRAQQTCSGWRQECLSNPRTKNPKSCDRGMAACMKTGRWVGPESGRVYGAAEKR
jgi:hypothetical protein